MTTDANDCDDDEYELVHLHSCMDPWRWLNKGETIHKHADLAGSMMDQIHASTDEDGKSAIMDCASTNLMQIGQAIECLLKARLISIGEITTPQEIKECGHNLPKMARSAKLKFTNDDRLLLDELKQLVLWAGKYPAPNSYKDVIRFNITRDKQGRGSLAYFMTEILNGDKAQRDRANALYEKIHTQVGPDIIASKRG